MNASWVVGTLRDAVGDPAAWGEEGKKHEIYAAAFGSHLFYYYFYRTGGGGGMAPSAPLDPLLQRW